MSINKKEEIIRCSEDFKYFCNYILLDISPYNYQLRLINHLEINKKTIFSKFRQGGFTTFIAIYIIWKCLFETNQKILWVTPNKFMSFDVSELMKKHIALLPEWLRGNVLKMTDERKKYFADTNSIIYFTGLDQSIRGLDFNYLIIEEAGLMDLEPYWDDILSKILSNEDNECVVFGTLTKEGFFNKLVKRSVNNLFINYKCSYEECFHIDFECIKSNISSEAWEIMYEQKIKEEEVKSKHGYRFIDE